MELECGRFHGPTGRHPRENEVGEESEMAHVFGAVQEPGPCGTRWGSVLQSTHVRRHKQGRVRVGDGRKEPLVPAPVGGHRPPAPQAFGGAPVIWSRRGAVLVPHVWGPPSRQPSHAHAPVEYHYQGQSQRARFVSRCRDEDPAPAVRKMLSRI